MEGLKYTAQEAMDLLKIPVNDQPKYMAKLYHVSIAVNVSWPKKIGVLTLVL